MTTLLEYGGVLFSPHAGGRGATTLLEYGSVLLSAHAGRVADDRLSRIRGRIIFASRRECSNRLTAHEWGWYFCQELQKYPKEPVGYGRRQSINGNCRGTTAQQCFMSAVLVLVAVCPLPPTPHPPILHQYLCKTLWGIAVSHCCSASAADAMTRSFSYGSALSPRCGVLFGFAH